MAIVTLKDNTKKLEIFKVGYFYKSKLDDKALYICSSHKGDIILVSLNDGTAWIVSKTVGACQGISEYVQQLDMQSLNTGAEITITV